MTASAPVFHLHSDRTVPSAARVMARCDELAAISSIDYGVERVYLSPEHLRCNSVVGEWMQAAGMTTWVDAAGNCWGRYAGNRDDAPVIILGSHLDTVTNAGKYDGILGVLSAIEIVEKLHQQDIRLPYAIEVVGFADEEGTRFGATLLGSRAVAGTWDARWANVTDKQGVSIAQAMTSVGLDIQAIEHASRKADNIHCYLELHIEQGPVLEEKNRALGIVNAIAGARRFTFTLQGMAGHAGTVPMAMRRDPLVMAAQVIQFVHTHVQQAEYANVVATVGKIAALPGAVNVIPGACEFSLDIRSDDDALRDKATAEIIDFVQHLGTEQTIGVTCNEIHSAPAVQCAQWLQRISFDTLVAQGDDSPITLTSGAGHDAMAFSGMTDIGMLFLRCKGGISHHPAESVTVDDVNAGLNAFYALLRNIP